LGLTTIDLLILRFFKWLYSSDIEPSKRNKPEVVNNIPVLKRKEKSIYKPDSKFCAKCRMVLTYDAYNETLEKQQEKESGRYLLIKMLYCPFKKEDVKSCHLKK
jgi:hypothetical protein